MKLIGVEVHQAANLFPMLDGSDLNALAEDIKTNGQRESCVLWQGKLLDGRNRWLACQILGIEPETVEMEDDNLDPISYVLSINLRRRHLNESQRAMVAAKLKEIFDARAKERQRAAGGNKKSGKPKEKSVMDNCPQAITARDEAGAALNVSGKSVDRATTVLKEGSKELIAAVESGEVPVSKAAVIVKTESKTVQLAAAREPRKPKQKTDAPATKGKFYTNDKAISESFHTISMMLAERSQLREASDLFEEAAEAVETAVLAWNRWRDE